MKANISNLKEVMKTVPPSGFVIKVSGDQRRIVIKIEQKEKGRMLRHRLGVMMIGRSFSIPHAGFAWEVEEVEAEQGYGPLLYDIAMEIVFVLDDAGLTPSRVSVSREARNVWKKYYETRGDVEKIAVDDDVFIGPLSERPDYMRHVYRKNETPIIDLLKEKDLLVSNDFDLV